MFALLFDLEDYATTYRATRDAYLKAANELKLATGPYKACLLYTSPSPRDKRQSRMPSSA